MKNFNFIIALVVIGVSIIFGCWLIRSSPSGIPFGASPGPDYFDQQFFWAGLVKGGEVTDVSGVATSSPTAAEFCESSILTYDPSFTTGMGTTTLPSTSTLANECLMIDGACKTVLFINTSGLTASTTMIVAPSGMDLIQPHYATTAAGPAAILAGGDEATIEICRYTTLVWKAVLTQIVDAD